MANRVRAHPANVPGSWFVDDSCIDCDACRQLAPSVFSDELDQSIVSSQPRTPHEEIASWRALVACPTASIGTSARRDVEISSLFPMPIDDGVYYCGYNSEDSFGANAFYVARAHGGLLIDSPRFATLVVRRLVELGGVAHILLTHRDDVADADRYAKRFGARVWIHEHDARAAPFATDVIRGRSPSEIVDGVTTIPLPGHTRGSVAFLVDGRYLFTGDSLAWDRESADLTAFRDACWYSWEEQTESLARLAEHRFEWVLAGHGDRRRLSAPEMHRRLRGLVKRMREPSFA
jgi:glyoxylase-like metal-dependent hydrolase (beta-lactamase superfamily II)/ferredoxin